MIEKIFLLTVLWYIQKTRTLHTSEIKTSTREHPEAVLVQLLVQLSETFLLRL